MSRNPKANTATRRMLLRTLLLGGVITQLAAPRRSVAQAAPHIDVKDPAALAVGYVDSVSQINLQKYPGYLKGSTCENCALLQGAAGEHYRPCSLFAGKLVSVSGWCSAWSPEI